MADKYDKYTDDQLKKIIEAEIANAGSGKDDIIDAERRDALKYYLGNMSKPDEGRSGVVSTDVADAIEWIMPELMKAFTQNNEVVTFDPTSANDIKQAEIESRFVYDTLMKKNNGFLILHTAFKDALMQKNGFFKCHYLKEDRVTYESYEQITDPELQMLLADDNVEATGLTTEVIDGINVHSVNIKRVELKGSVCLSVVPPEDMRIYRRHNSVDLSLCRFVSQAMSMTRSDLVKQGYDRDVIYSIKQAESSMEQDSRRSYRFNYQNENVGPIDNSPSIAPENDLLDVTEAFMFLDMDDDGIAEYVKITYVGDDKVIEVLDIEEVEDNPFTSITAIIMSHKLFGLSIYDRLKELQDIKTAMWRNMLDNMYLQNNQRTIVMENMVNLDDLLNVRPGGIIRAKSLEAVKPFQTAPLSSDIYTMMNYVDQVRSGRVGVSPEGSIHDSAMGDAVGSEGLQNLLTQKEELVGLMVRVLAETGVKTICLKIRDLLVSNQDLIEDYEFRGEWLKIQPSRWSARTNTTIRVGTGSGNRKEQAAVLSQVLAFQTQIVAQPGQSLVTPNQVFAALNDLLKASGMPGAAAYFLDPNSPEGQQNKQLVDASMQKQQQAELEEKRLLSEAQAKIANAEQTKAQSMMESVKVKAENERLKTALETIKAQTQSQLADMKQQLEEAQLAVKDSHHTQELQFKYDQLAQQYELAIKQLEGSGENNGSDNE